MTTPFGSTSGAIDVNQVLSLRNLAIDDDEWKAAMDAIADAITTVSRRGEYIRLYQREPSGKVRGDQPRLGKAVRPDMKNLTPEVIKQLALAQLLADQTRPGHRV